MGAVILTVHSLTTGGINEPGFPWGPFLALVSGFLSFLGLVMLEMKFSKMSSGGGGV